MHSLIKSLYESVFSDMCYDKYVILDALIGCEKIERIFQAIRTGSYPSKTDIANGAKNCWGKRDTRPRNGLVPSRNCIIIKCKF